MLPKSLTISTVHDLVRSGAASPPEIIHALLARIGTRSDLDAFITLADELPATNGDGPLTGAFGRTVIVPLQTAQAVFDETGVTRVDI